MIDGCTNAVVFGVFLFTFLILGLVVGYLLGSEGVE